MEELFRELKDTHLLRITGSYADGTFNEDSDIDFFVKPDRPETDFENRNILKIITILKKHNIKLRSSMPGYIYTHRTTGNGHLPIQMEFSDLYKPRKNRKKDVEVYGVKFKTY